MFGGGVDINWTWNYANYFFSRGQSGTRLIVAYNGELLQSLKENRSVYILKPGVSSFKDALIGIIRVNFV